MKLGRLTLVAILVVLAVLALVACDGSTTPADCEHAYSSEVTAKATCTDEGTTTFTCSKCGDTYTESIAAKGHTYTDRVVAPTCTEEGYTLHTCVCGDTYQDNTVAAKGHSYISITTAPTCTEEGYTEHTCVCGHTYKDATVAATGHSYTETVTAPTCTAEGYTTYTCDCGHTYKDNTVAATGHSYTDKVVAPTCKADGYTEHTCACGDTYKDTVVPATGNHAYTAKEVAATCTAEGSIKYTCVLCNDSYTETLPVTEHAFVYYYGTEPTCISKGQTTYVCETCGLQDQTFTPATGVHQYKDTVVAPTCKDDGYTLHTCETCGTSYQDTVVPAGEEHHVYKPTIVALSDAEAKENPDAIAVQAMICSVCGKEDETAIRRAVLIDLNFDTEPDADTVASYEGSEGYKTYMGLGPAKNSTYAAYLIDSQKHLDLITSVKGANFATSTGVTLENGTMTTGNYAVFSTDLKLGRNDCAFGAYTISFDMTVSRTDPTLMFVIGNTQSPSNNRPIILTAKKDPASNDYFLVVQNTLYGPTIFNVTTDYKIRLGEAYSYKIDFTGGSDYTVTVSVKKVSETDYTEVGTFAYKPDTNANTFVYLAFSYGSKTNPGARVDNILVTTPVSTATCTEHDYVSVVTKAETCAEKGTMLYACRTCGDSYSEDIPATGKHDYEAVVTAPTCTEDGYTTHTCTVCEGSYTDTPTAATGHAYTSVEVPAGCVDGYFLYTCGNCGDTYTEPSGKPAVNEHEWEKTSTIAPTCGENGYLVYTCKNCKATRNEDDPDAPATGKHTYKAGIRELTEEELVLNPDAIGVEGSFCAVCGAADPAVTQVAVLINLDFEEVPSVGSYEGSDAYQAALTAAGSAATNDAKAFLAYFDSQKNVALEGGWGATKASLIQNGKYVCTNDPVYIVNDLGLSLSSPAVASYTMTFDTVVNVTGKTDNKLVDATQFFALTDNKKYNNRTLVLALNQTDVDTNAADDVHTYELVAASLQYGAVKVKEATGYKITLGKEYSFKLVVTPSAKSYELYVKEAGATEYTSVGTYSYAPAGTISCINFALSSTNNGNVFDNFKVTTPFVTE